MTDSNNTTQSKSKPVFQKKLPGGISAAVFENTRDGRTYRSINLQRSYLHNGKWNRMSIYLNHDQIPFMIEALQGTWQFLNNYPVTSADDTDGQPEVSDTAHAEA